MELRHIELTKAKIFARGFKSASRNGLEYEFVEWLFDELEVTDEMLEKAVEFSMREWDL